MFLPVSLTTRQGAVVTRGNRANKSASWAERGPPGLPGDPLSRPGLALHWRCRIQASVAAATLSGSPQEREAGTWSLCNTASPGTSRDTKPGAPAPRCPEVQSPAFQSSPHRLGEERGQQGGREDEWELGAEERPARPKLPTFSSLDTLQARSPIWKEQIRTVLTHDGLNDFRLHNGAKMMHVQ